MADANGHRQAELVFARLLVIILLCHLVAALATTTTATRLTLSH